MQNPLCFFLSKDFIVPGYVAFVEKDLEKTWLIF